MTARRRSPTRRAAPLTAVAVSAVLVLATACGAGGDSRAASPTTGASRAPVAGGTLRFSVSGDPLCLDGHAISSGLNQFLGRIITDTVTTLDRRGRPAPYLAESWDISPDGTTYTFHLRKGVTFSDGTPWNAEAFQVNLEHMRDPATKSPLAAAYIAPYESSRIIDEYTLEVHLAYPYTPFLYVLAQAWLGMESPKQIREAPETMCDKPIGTGPFVVESYARNQRITYVRRDDYNWAPSWLKHKGPAYLDRIEVTIVPEALIRYQSLVSGQYDITDLVPPQNAAAVEANPNLVFKNLTRPGHPNAVWFNTSRPPFDDVRVRRAFVAATDVAAIAQSVGFGYYPVKDNYLASNSKYYDPTTEGVLRYDPALANRLLDEAGWTGRDSAGYRTKNGRRLTVELPTNESATPSPQLVQLQGQVKKVGFELKIVQLPPAQLTERRYSGDYDLTSGYWHTNTTDVLYIRYHSSEIPSAERIGQNASYLRDAELDAILEKARATPDGPEAAALYSRAQHRLLELVPALPLWEANAQWAYHTYVKDIAVDTSHPQPVFTAAWLDK
ncbi:peptide/nickel transport system substrate-binding protein [Thermasporomyces composti]|uniref:Peptide/nickel transport system substrate-binding protein n=1 Tax=Thermasporomyces composti TaxID=696763 RepID=A0A3D9VBH4_THECX|nr:peptide/nickel transport system substrate-binding protein [Thermasporomyces composti]